MKQANTALLSGANRLEDTEHTFLSHWEMEPKAGPQGSMQGPSRHPGLASGKLPGGGGWFQGTAGGVKRELREGGRRVPGPWAGLEVKAQSPGAGAG